jgi:hypothetical protein
MKDARELLEEFTAASVRDPKKAAEMFTEDGAFEIPYLEALAARLTSDTRRSVAALPADLSDKSGLAKVEAILRNDQTIAMLSTMLASAQSPRCSVPTSRRWTISSSSTSPRSRT